MSLSWSRLLTGCCAVALLAFSPILRAEDANTKPARVLMLTQSKGFTHGSVRRKAPTLAPAEVAMIQLGEQTGLFKVDCTQDAAADFTKENLQNYDIVMFYTTGNLPIADEDMKYFLEDWLKQDGHGLIGFHSATDTYKNFEPYWDMIGGTFNGHPWGAGTTVTIAVHDRSHPATAPLDEELVIKDEIYQYKNWQPEKVRVLMSLDMSKCKPSKPYHVPVAWCKAWGDGKIFYTNLGHRNETWANPKFQQQVVGAVNWILGNAEGSAEPNPELSKAQDKLAAEVAN